MVEVSDVAILVLGAVVGLLGLAVLYLLWQMHRITASESRPESVRMSQVEEKLDKFRKTMDALNAASAAINERARKVDGLAEQAKYLDGLVRENVAVVKRSDGRLGAIEGQLKEMDESRGELYKGIAQLNQSAKEMTKLSAKIEAFEKTLREAERGRGALGEEQGKLGSSLMNLEGEIGKLRTSQALQEEFRADSIRAAAGLRNDVSEVQKRMHELPSSLERIEAAMRRIDEFETSLATFNETKDKVMDVISANRAELKELEAKLGRLRVPMVYEHILSLNRKLDEYDRFKRETGNEVAVLRERLADMRKKYYEITSPDAYELLAYEDDIKRIEGKIEGIERGILKSVPEIVRKSGELEQLLKKI